MNKLRYYFALLGVLSMGLSAVAQTGPRRMISLDANWYTVANDTNKNAYQGFEQSSFQQRGWKKVNVPHNWDQYGGYRRLMHGNRHGYSWYRKTLDAVSIKPGKRYFLWFEGVGSYATVYLNGKKVAYHAGGRTSFTVDVTAHLNNKKANLLAVKADHPASIRDLPWVCGGCSEERGFSEGSQPMGIFRPVHLIETSEVRITPFGVHIWNDTTISAKSAKLNMETEVRNYGAAKVDIQLVSTLIDKNGKQVFSIAPESRTISPGQTATIRQLSPRISDPHLWSLEDPYLYTLRTQIKQNGKLLDELETSYGVRWISWPIGRANGDKRFYLNGKPVLINGIGEYEHLMGQSHAFSAEQIHARAEQIKAAGFNSFRDAHQPHNLRYQEYWDKEGILWWPQMAAHVWFDNPAFRENFKTLMTDWIRERRNSPSIILWGLENESTLPEAFARECSDIIRKLDPTASVQRLITTCNGGSGTDWNVPQNWTGTYGGDPHTYAADLERQLLVGEYGAWRTLDLHTEGPFQVGGAFSEDRMTQLMELKVRLAEQAREKTTGHYFWIFNSHDNPGRVQGGEGKRELDRVGPVNYKGLLTPWEEPLDVYYMFRSNFAAKEKEPMVYIVSHTWPDRWTSPGLKDSITVYSNCDEVELFNDVDGSSLGRQRKNGIGTHFQWSKVDIRYNVLSAVGYVNGKAVAKDLIVLRHLPASPNFSKLYEGEKNLTAGRRGFNYLYRVNCGGPDYKDLNGNIWRADQHKEADNTWGSLSWTEDYPGMPAFFASQRRTNEPIKGSKDWPLFQTFRYGRDKLKYEFDLSNGEYLVELYFAEPWFDTNAGADCTGWRLFDVAANGRTVLNNIDLWKEAGRAGAVKKSFTVKVSEGKLVLDFPEVLASQAVISGIAIASSDRSLKADSRSSSIIRGMQSQGGVFVQGTWMDTGDRLFSNADLRIIDLPSTWYGAEWIAAPYGGASKSLSFSLAKEADVSLALSGTAKPAVLQGFESVKEPLVDSRNQHYQVFRKRFKAGERVTLSGLSENLSVAVLPATTLQPAFDLKAVKGYKAPQANFTSGIVKSTINGKDAVTFEKESGDVLEWTISTGVADTYSLTVKYANTTTEKMTARLQLLLADGTLMKEEVVELVPSKPGKWNYYNTSTGTMINAGTYKLKLTAIKAKGLGVSGLDVQ